ncbi:hypothetical protein HOLleu_10075 [Holothuria leucospilota]|uniref:Uncharacterized protein n=1 Tax=Holothuria leucospilota TaxID=206669 RepID=A0A9Q1CEM2_HOLLE|nr:hypothetical protein HOLleu_10075 [Holothuria leucospilota]
MRNEIATVLKSKGISDDLIAEIVHEIETKSEFTGSACALHKLRDTFSSSHNRSNYYQKNFSVVNPEEIYLGKDSDHKDCYLHYIPIHCTLKQLLKDESVMEQFSKPDTNKKPDSYADFTDGSSFKGNTFFQTGRKIILLLFQDAFEIVNPLGSARTKHKVLATYMSLGGPGLPPCLAHDLFEGVVSYDLHLYLMSFIKSKKWLTIELLNKRITDFKYKGKDKLDKPVKVKSNPVGKLTGHAVQNWNLLRLLPLMISDIIQDFNDEVWQLILSLREIVDLVCSPCISCEQLQYLQDLITFYLQSRQKLFPEQNVKPKHHYLTHYPKLITQFGPLIKV